MKQTLVQTPALNPIWVKLNLTKHGSQFTPNIWVKQFLNCTFGLMTISFEIYKLVNTVFKTLFKTKNPEFLRILKSVVISHDWLIKGQLISKCLLDVFNFLQKTNENKSTWGLIIVKKNSFVCFLEEMATWKNHFDFL